MLPPIGAVGHCCRVKVQYCTATHRSSSISNCKPLASRSMPPMIRRFQPSSTEIRSLYNAIDSATPDRLRTLLKDLSATAPANFAYVQSKLMLQPGTLKRAWAEYEKSCENGDEDEEDENNGDGSDDTTEDAGHDYESTYSDEQAHAPASRQRFEICGQCNEEYDVLLNDRKSCEWHDGKLPAPHRAKADTCTERC